MKILDRVIKPIFNNMSSFVLACSVAGLLNFAASNQACASLELGILEFFLDLALGKYTKTAFLYLFIFYLIAIFALALNNKENKIKEIEEKFFRPLVVPIIFQISGFALGLAINYSTYKFMENCILSVFLMVIALFAYNVSAIFGSLLIAKKTCV